MSQQELAERISISPSYLSLLESGKKDPSLPMLRSIATGLGLTVDVLILAAIDFDDLRKKSDDLADLFGQMVAALVV